MKINSRRGRTIPSSITPGEAIYIRDESTGEVWSPTALPIRDETATYMARHGQGYSRFQHGSHGILLDLLQFVPPEDPIKISRLTLQNNSGRTRRLSVTAYAEWVLGKLTQCFGALHHHGTRSVDGSALCAECMGPESLAGASPLRILAGDRLRTPETAQSFWDATARRSVRRRWNEAARFRKRVGAGLDPCAALQTTFELRPGATRGDCVFSGASGKQRAGARVAQALSRRQIWMTLLREVTGRWDDLLGDGAGQRHPNRAWICCSIAGCSTRRSAAASGRVQRSIS